MCGLFFATPSPANTEQLSAAVSRSMQHRGTLPTAVHEIDGQVFAHTLLPVQGDGPVLQPLVTEDHVLVYSGELWEHPGDTSDTQYLFDRLRADDASPETVASLHGMFAFLISLRNRATVRFATDPFGEMPLYYVHQGDRLLVANERKQLVCAGVPRGQVRPAAPGLLYTFSRRTGELSAVPYHEWSFTNDDPDVDAARLRALVRASVRARYETIDLQSAALLLSGGLDSAILAFELADLGLRDAFVVAAAEDAPDVAMSRAVGSTFGLRVGAVVAERLAPDCAMAVTEVQNRSIVEEMCCHVVLSNHLAARGTRVVFSGCGADEIFVGYQHLLRYRNKQTRRHLQREFVTKYPEMDLRAFNKAYMLNAVEVRNPYLSRELLDYAATLDVDTALIGAKRRMKVALRTAYASELGELVDHPKLIARETMGAKARLQAEHGESPYAYRKRFREIFSDPIELMDLVDAAQELR